MRRLPAIAALGVLAIVPLGCGFESYEARLEATQSRILDEMTINQTLAGVVQGNFSQQNISLRPPQGLAQAQQFQLIPLNPGYFEVEGSFIAPGSEGQLASGPFQLHILARREVENPPEGQPEQPPVARGDFRSDVLNILSQVYGPEITSAPVEPVSKTVWPRSDPAQSISYDLLQFTDPNQQLVQIYFYDEQSGGATYNVALIWEFPGGTPPSGGSNPVDLTLGTFSVGQQGTAAQPGGQPEGAPAGGAVPGGPAPGAPGAPGAGF